jgi:ABC-type nickel/cobalt efflux system permease component RcnA
MNGRVFCHENNTPGDQVNCRRQKSKLKLQPDHNPGKGCGHDHSHDSEAIDNHDDLRMFVIIFGIQAITELLVLQPDDGPGNSPCRQCSQNG